MSNPQYKPLNPSAKLVDGRFGGSCFFIHKTFSNALPKLREHVVEENREDGYIVAELNGKRFVLMAQSMYNNGWSILSKVGKFEKGTPILMLGMSTREENDNLPRRLFVFNFGDVDVTEIDTKQGRRAITGFKMDKQDDWAQFACTLPDIGKAIRSLADGVVDPDIPAGPFKSHLQDVINDTASAPTGGTSNSPSLTQASDDQDDDDDGWDDSVPF